MSVEESNVCNHVKVAVRVRPENEREKEGNYRKVVQVVDKYMLVFDPKEEELSFFQSRKASNRDITRKANKDAQFVFDNVFDENSTQADIFDNLMKGMLDGFLNGYNCTVLAYGATGAGKTHTMLGLPSDPGVMYLTMKELYSRIDLLKDEIQCDIAVSYLEVYNEQIRDLLVNSGPLAVREDSIKGVVVQGLSLLQPKSAEQILEMLDYGNKNRTQHPTDVNASSSRSHAVFQIYLRQQSKTANINQNIKIAKMSLIDLAGSERVSATNTKGARLREGANINRSLLALGNVINALADPKSKKSHIPYRNSKLTRLLKDSLGGNCRTIMIAAVSPSALYYDDTYNTLKYANRAKDIQSSLKSNVVNLESHVGQYAVICEQQKEEIRMLKERLKEYEEKKIDIPEKRRLSLLTLCNQKNAEYERLEDTLKSIFLNRTEIRKEILSFEKKLKESELRMLHQKCTYHHIQLLCFDEKAVKETCKFERRIASLAAYHSHLRKKLQEVKSHLAENDNWLHRTENEMLLCDQTKNLQKELLCHSLQLEVLDVKQQMECLTSLFLLQGQENQLNEKALQCLLPAFRRQYQILKSANLASSFVEADYKECEQLVRREKGVVWADQLNDESTEPCSNYNLNLASIISFSSMSHQNTPCSTRKRKRKSLERRCSTVLTEKPQEAEIKDASKQNTILLAGTGNSLPQLEGSKQMDFSPVRKPLAPIKLQFNDSFSEDGICPLPYTPEVCHPHLVNCPRTETQRPENLGKSSSYEKKNEMDSDPANIAVRSDDSVTTANTTITLSPSSSKLQTTEKCLPQPKISKVYSKVSHRLPLPALLNETSIKLVKPSYMAMTSAAQRRRRLSCNSASLNSLRAGTQGTSAPKRMRLDPLSVKAMRVPKSMGDSRDQSKQITSQFRHGRTILERNPRLPMYRSNASLLKAANLLKTVTDKS
ncbi:LOW QUALITY PROTEIN: kinesin-like protein KIF18A [Erpetoichthys calabaricus]|uniref:LOW QUALITY PROTEIN: kinesin-like protein KIF18A n=1 Tax=Erpetoichthys calabaricus TaxID=27687 RepID=UPI002234468D|nr:LOW QUALITY PROTEIN: kinesin-like protein KIF18A [Erpetoichthys calabaricus]